MQLVKTLVAVLVIVHTVGFAQSGWVNQSSGTVNDLLKVCMTDANTGTAVGEFGTILRTTNAGATWTSQSSGTSNHRNNFV